MICRKCEASRIYLNLKVNFAIQYNRAFNNGENNVMSPNITINHAKNDFLYRAEKLKDRLFDIRKKAVDSMWALDKNDFTNLLDSQILDTISEEHAVETLCMEEPTLGDVEEDGRDYIIEQTIPFTGDVRLLTNIEAELKDIVGEIYHNPNGRHKIVITVNIKGDVFDKSSFADILPEIENTLKPNTEAIQKLAEQANKETIEHNKNLTNCITNEIKTRRRRNKNAAA